MLKIPFVIVLITCLITGAFTRGKAKQSIVTSIKLKHWVGNKEMKLFDETYTNPFGEPFIISKFRYYISAISLTDNNQVETSLAGRYFLVNEADTLSKTIELLTVAPVATISFVLGVDSATNTGGVQTGGLDPANGMFWTWNSGYIFAKLEGQSDVSPAPAHSFTWDVGGFRHGQNALRKVTLVLNKNGTARSSFVVNADVLQWFNAVHPLKIAQSPVCHQPGELAKKIADNYSAMFSVAP
ncbi:MAG: MbnP family protein [Chitinophagaceae bacterium]